METIKIQSNNISKQEVGFISDFLKNGKVIVTPTDTIYGLSCLATDKKAIKKIYAIKKKEKKKPMLVLVSSVAEAEKYFKISSEQKKILAKIWPGPFTLILDTKGTLPAELSGGAEDNGIGVRLPKAVFLRKIIKAVGAPIVSTSANVTGQEPIFDPKDIVKVFKKKLPDLVVDGGVIKGKPSKLIDLRDVDYIKILR